MRKVGLLLLGSAFTVGASWVVGCGDSAGNAGGAGGTQPTTAVTTASGPSGPGATNSTSTASGTASTSSSTGTGIPANFDCNPTDGSTPTLKLTPVATGLNESLLVKSAPDNIDRLYIVQKSGQIMISENGQVLPTPFLDISSLVNDFSEEGLLGLAFHPNYAQNGRFFVHYSSKTDGGDNRVEEYHRSADPLVADPTPVQLVFLHATLQSNHNGGALEFGPDNYLYISMGDGGNQQDPECDAQNTTFNIPNNPLNGTPDLLGKISRVDVEGTPDAGGYPAAPGNPNGAKYYHIGLRNPWRMSFDGCTGDLWIGDVGQDTWEEVDLAKAGSGPLNFGWPYREGKQVSPFTVNSPPCPPNPGNLTDPITDYQHTGYNSIVGGYVYRSSAIPGLRGAYFFADSGTGNVSTAVFDTVGNKWVITPQPALSATGGTPSIVSFGQDGRGNVYEVTIEGDVSRIDAQ